MCKSEAAGSHFVFSVVTMIGVDSWRWKQHRGKQNQDWEETGDWFQALDLAVFKIILVL